MDFSKEIAEMTNSEKKKIYGVFNWAEVKNKCVQQTWWRKQYSKNSYSFKADGIDNKDVKSIDDVQKTLTRIFDIAYPELFREKLGQVCNGDGVKNNIKEILMVHSSALCALLFFYAVDKRPLMLRINGKDITFTKSFFEWKNPVFDRDSNMDVVLFSEKSNVLFFLESKFSEYYTSTSDFKNISYKYAEKGELSRSIYNKLIKETDYTTDFSKIKYIENKKEKDGFQIQCKHKNYIGGTKQALSHYLGIINYLNGELSPQNTYAKEVRTDENTQFYFGEILFDAELEKLKFKGEERTYFNAYREKYQALAKILNEDIPARTNKRLKVLDDVLRYSLFKSNECHIEPKIYRFYLGS